MVIPVTVHADAPNQILPEYQVGAATERCTFPGIAQCFAIVGQCPDKMVCAHVSPGTTQDQMGEIFTALDNLGGAAASAWYIVGPCDDHFQGNHTVWKSRRHVKKTFTKAFGKDVKTFLLDASAERNVKRPDARVGGALFKINAIDIRAMKMGIGVNFTYREQVTQVSWGPWQPLMITKFSKL